MSRLSSWFVALAVSLSGLALSGPSASVSQDEEKVTLDQVPAPVRKAIEAAVGGGVLVDIGVFSQKGERVYEIEMIVDRKEYDVLFDGQGNVLRRSFEGEKRAPAAPAAPPDRFQREFDLQGRKLSATGRNRYFVLVPGYQLVLEGAEGEHAVQLAITVLDETRSIAGIETRVVEERESVDGELVEISRNFFAICERTTSVFYFGEEVDLYQGGQIVGHEGAWLHGAGGARAGLMMPGEPIVGARYYQEVAPGEAMDRAEVVDLTTSVATPAGTFPSCLRVQEENPLDGEREFKLHAPGVGLVQDEDLLLVRHGFVR